MSFYRGIPFNGGMDAPTGAGAQHIVQTDQAICDWLIDGTTPAQCEDDSSAVSLNWQTRRLFDDGEVLALSWIDRTLLDNTSTSSIDWASRGMFDSGGGPSLSYDDRVLENAAGIQTVDWNNGIFTDAVTNAQIMKLASGLSFFGVTAVVRQTGGAATAGVVYSATEQGMINRMYTALRNYGLLT